MKKARLILSASLLTIAAFTSVTMVSCSKDDDTCPTGYEGNKCETLSSAKFVGSYSVQEDCSVSGAVGPYSTTIVQSTTNQVNILLNDFGDFSATITVTGSVDQNALTISSQTVAGYTISGNGSYSNGVISITYTVQDPTGGQESCNATWTKQ